MKTRTENIEVKGLKREVEFGYYTKFDSVEILNVNGISWAEFSDDFIQECQSACDQFMREEEVARKEAIAEERGDELRDNIN